MTGLSGLLTGGGRGRAIALAVFAILIPLLVMLTLLPRQTQEQVPVAIVNLDVPIGDGGTPVAAGKLVTENLLTADDGIAWTLTDTATADQGLAQGTYLAVVTIPADFSQDVATLGTDAPTQASLTVQTSTRHGYLSGVLAEALAAGLPRGVEAQLTSGYVSGTLAAFTELHTGIGQAADGASELASGIGDAAGGAAVLAEGQRELVAGLEGIGTVLRALPTGVRDLGALSAAAGSDAAALAGSLAGAAIDAEALSLAQDLGVADLDALAAVISADPTVPAGDLLDDILALRSGAAAIASDLQNQAGALAGDAVDAAELAVGADAVADLAGPAASALTQLAAAQQEAVSGASDLAAGAADLASGLDTAAGAAGELASGLGEAASSIPSYSSAQQQSIAATVASPIGVTTTSIGGPDSALAAAVAALAPVSLWLGALATFLVVSPFARASLVTPATSAHIAADAALVAMGIAVVQSVLVWLGVAVLGVVPDRIAVAYGLTLAAAVSFTLFHQALTALFGRAGLIVSVLALGLQLVAAGTLQPVTEGSLAATPFSILPLSVALQGADALVGGSLHEVLGAAVGLLLWAAVAFAGTVIGVRRARSRAVSALLPA